jgi:hypothetical protein
LEVEKDFKVACSYGLIAEIKRTEAQRAERSQFVC